MFDINIYNSSNKNQAWSLNNDIKFYLESGGGIRKKLKGDDSIIIKVIVETMHHHIDTTATLTYNIKEKKWIFNPINPQLWLFSEDSLTLHCNLGNNI